MKRIVTVFILAIFLSSSIFAKSSIPLQEYKVEVISYNQGSKSFGRVALAVGGFVFNIISSAMADTQSVQNLVHNLEDYIIHNGFDINNISREFENRLELSIIKNFQASKSIYNQDEYIDLNFELREKSYVYLLNISKNDASTISNNHLNNKNYFEANIKYNFAEELKIRIKTDDKGKEIFYLISSIKKLDFDIYHNKNMAIKTIEKLKNQKLVDVKRVEIEVI